MDDAGESGNDEKNTIPPPRKTEGGFMPSPHAMDQANSELKEKLDNLVVAERSKELANYGRGWDGEARESAIKRLELSDSNSNRIAHDMLSSEPKKMAISIMSVTKLPRVKIGLKVLEKKVSQT